ncbi:alanine--tRNA ligase [Candidatus Woesearchaeota archaeon]|nr:MAG: alanine--tRNA ligase [Candidatus Woesearchaeota archaeon]
MSTRSAGKNEAGAQGEIAPVSDKEAKRQFKKEAEKSPEQFYPVEALKKEGFVRKTCTSCGTRFWSVHEEQGRCGDPACSGGFRFIGQSPAKKKLSYVEVWKRFAKVHERFGYTPVRRYPVVARWNPTTEFTIASIAAFQPFVVSGEVDPPANPLTIPQFCLRFGDVDNVGITGHNVGFVMMGEHAFTPPDAFDINTYFSHHLSWLRDGLGVPVEELTIHEDAWAGGGNVGSCVEFFSRGLELSNQVYMQFEQTPRGLRKLKIGVLDMGQGQERAAWFTQGCATNYDAAFPGVMKRLYRKTGLAPDEAFMRSFLPVASYLNVDEVEDVEKAWIGVAKKVGLDVVSLRERVLPIAALYSVAEHTRALLVALADNALPSNVGGGYNLRVILRRALGFCEQFGWDINLGEVAEWHARELEPLFPELLSKIGQVKTILDVEKKKFVEHKKRTRRLVESVVSKNVFSESVLLDLYDSHGVTPQEVVEAAKQKGVDVRVPDNFFAKVAERHERRVQEVQTRKEKRISLGDVPKTICLYYDHYDYVDFEGHVVFAKGNFVVLDRTAFYPTSGGQLHDEGTLAGVRVRDVFKQDGVVVHELEKEVTFRIGQLVQGRIDKERRVQLTQHHTATHIMNAAAKKVLGDHIFQAGAAKTLEKARIDVTHWEIPSEQELKEIERVANRIVEQNIPVEKMFLPRNVAEAMFGFDIYQGGAVPGKMLRIVHIKGVDVEACGGTHLDLTGEAVRIKLLKCTKVQDGVIRLEFAAGAAAERLVLEEEELIRALCSLLGVEERAVPGRVEELFRKWKLARKAKKKNQPPPADTFKLVSKADFEGNVLERCVEIVGTQKQDLPRTIKRFLHDLDELHSFFSGNKSESRKG